jgi:hypothetical protein
MIVDILHQVKSQIADLKNQNRIEDARALYKEWEQQYDENNQVIEILMFNDLTLG